MEQNAKKKISCGGFMLGEGLVLSEDGKTLSVSGGGGSGGVTTLHINVTAVNWETMKATFTADKTPAEMSQAAATGPVWCVVTFAAGIMDDSAVSIGVPPAWLRGEVAFGVTTAIVHEDDGSNNIIYAVRRGLSDSWILDLNAFES